jgi:hypothetical protein
MTFMMASEAWVLSILRIVAKAVEPAGDGIRDPCVHVERG